MTRLYNLAFAALTFSAAFTHTMTVEAGCGGGGGYRGSHISRGYSSYSRPAYQPTYRAPSYHTPSYQAPVQQPQVIQQQPQLTPQQFVTQQTPQTAPVQQSVAQPQQPVSQFQPQAPQPNQPSAMDLALRALGDFGPQPTTSPQPQAPQAPTHVGNFQARLSNGSVVQLTLANNGQFTWSATNNEGKVSQFSGSYNVGNGSLSLARSTDNQTLNGSLTNLNANGFRFQLGSSQAALDFVRS